MSKKLSAVKKMQVSLRNRSRNRKYKSTIKTYAKKYFLSLQDSSNNKINDNSKTFLNLSLVYQAIDKAVKRGVLHKNTAARKKSILARSRTFKRII